jgi:putative protein kinase ArgK-like GTPase of G3E family
MSSNAFFAESKGASIIGITGPAGSGKTTLAASLGCAVLGMDAYHFVGNFFRFVFSSAS